MNAKLLVFDSHPVQYRVPVWQAAEKMQPGSLHVAYATDCSVRGHVDTGFGQAVAWDEPMLSGYGNTLLNCEHGTPLSGWGSLTGKGIKRIINEVKPSAVLLTGLNYKYDMIAYLTARLKGIPVWLRCETQDEAIERSDLKNFIRSIIYKIAYTGLSRVFFIGELNRQHYLKHGVRLSKLIPAHYATVDRFSAFSGAEKTALRVSARNVAKIDAGAFVIGFSGKFITKKNPGILFNMLKDLSDELRSKVHLYFMGSGELENDLRNSAEEALQKYGVKSYFTGFVNQSQLAGHYLAMDIMVLPSRRMGETWGLVANEAMQAGCGVVVSNAVGCAADFKDWARFRIFSGLDTKALAVRVSDLYQFRRDFDWAAKGLTSYTIESVAAALIREITI